MSKAYTIGLDFGTNSVRTIVVDCANGRTIGESVFHYPSGHQGVILDRKDHNLARQNPADYIIGLEKSIIGALGDAKRNVESFSNDDTVGMGIDTTGSTPIPVDKDNLPLALKDRFKDVPAAFAWLWKDHTSHVEAAKITETAARHRPHYLDKIGGTYSSEWFWAKIWHCLKSDPDVFEAAYSWVELADFIPALLVGITDPGQIKRGVCPAGHKALYSDEWGGLPDKEFLTLLDKRLARLKDRLYEKAFDSSKKAGVLCQEWAKKLGLSEGIPITMGAFDAHYAAIGAGVCTGTLVKIIGTSSCDCAVSPLTKPVEDIPGICGIVKGSILPNYYGIEAGQSAVGDIFKWFVETICEGDEELHRKLTEEASGLKPGESGLLVLDWNHGNRTILVDQRLSGLLLGQSLYTTRAEIYRALIEATAFGARMIIERIQEYGVQVDKIVACGGIADKNVLLMQIYADVTGCVMQISGSTQTSALGAAISAAVIAGKTAGGYDNFAEAQQFMTTIKPKEYHPDEEAKRTYDKLFKLYQKCHDSFGGVDTCADLSSIMKELIVMKEKIRKSLV